MPRYAVIATTPKSKSIVPQPTPSAFVDSAYGIGCKLVTALVLTGTPGPRSSRALEIGRHSLSRKSHGIGKIVALHGVGIERVTNAFLPTINAGKMPGISVNAVAMLLQNGTESSAPLN